MKTNNKLVQDLIDLGVHIGTDLSHGYNRQYNEYIIGLFPYKENAMMLSINPRHVTGKGRTRRIPIIDLYKSIFFLKRAVSFIRGVSMNMGRLLLYHPTVYEDINFLLIFARVINRHRHAFLHRPWQYGTLTNYYFSFYSMIRKLHDYDSLKRRKKISFTGLFLRLSIHSYVNIPRDTTVREHIQSTMKFWRAVVFPRYFRIFYATPDVLITLNPSGAVGAIDECGQLGIPVVATVDTNGSFTPVSYPLLSNDDSYTIAIYYFILFMNVYASGRVERYRSNMPSINAVRKTGEVRVQKKKDAPRVGKIRELYKYRMLSRKSRGEAKGKRGYSNTRKPRHDETGRMGAKRLRNILVREK